MYVSFSDYKLQVYLHVYFDVFVTFDNWPQKLG